MKRPVGGENDASGKWVIVAAVVAVVLVIIVVLFALLGGLDLFKFRGGEEEKHYGLDMEQADNSGLTRESEQPIQKAPDEVDLKDVESEEPEESETPKIVRSNGGGGTSQKSLKAQLMEILKETIIRSNRLINAPYDEMNQSGANWLDEKNLDRPCYTVLIPVVELLRQNEGEVETSLTDELVFAEDHHPYDGDTDGWSYWDHIGTIGNYLFNWDMYDSFDEVPPNELKSNLLRRFVEYKVFDFNVDSLGSMDLVAEDSKPEDERDVLNMHVEGDKQMRYEVAQNLTFSHTDHLYDESTGQWLDVVQKYRAMFGKRNGEWVLLDVVHVGDEVNPMRPEVDNAVDIHRGKLDVALQDQG